MLQNRFTDGSVYSCLVTGTGAGVNYLIVDGLRLSEAIRTAERYGVRVHNARVDERARCVLEVTMDTAAANAFALALVDVDMEFVPHAEYALLAS